MELSDECIQKIVQSLKTEDALKKMSNEKIADLLTDTLWAHCPLMSPQSDLLSEVIERLKQKVTAQA